MATLTNNKKLNGSGLSQIADIINAAIDKILALIGKKVDKDGDKVLSDNNYSTEEKNKLANIASGADVNVIEEIDVNGAKQTVTAKKVNIAVPTKVSDLQNDENYLKDHQDISHLAPKNSPALAGTPTAPTAASGTDTTQIATTAFVQAALQGLKSDMGSALTYKGSVDKYENLPSTNLSKGDTYNVVAAHGNTPAGTNYAWNGTAWDPLGGDVDLSNYATLDDVAALSYDEIKSNFVLRTISDGE